MRRPLLALVTLVAILGACSREAEETSAGSAIVNGRADGDAHDAVVLIVGPSDTAGYTTRCTGTVVAPNLVLTARHCVSKTDGASVCNVDGTTQSGGRILSDRPATAYQIFTGADATRTVASRVAAAVPGVADTKARGKQIVVERGKAICDRDVAFLVLDRDLDVPVAPLRLGPPEAGERLTAVGWGYTEAGVLATKRMVRDGITANRIGPRVLGTGGAGLGASEFDVGEAICQGDSGGPTFAASGAVVGVVSRVVGGSSRAGNAAAGCMGPRTVGTYTHLGEKAALVRAAFAAAGHEPVRETSEETAPEADAGADAATDAGATTDAGTLDAGALGAGALDAGAPDAGTEEPAIEVQGADAGATEPAASPTTSDAGGCSAVPRGQASTFGLGFAGLLGLVAVRRRRR